MNNKKKFIPTSELKEMLKNNDLKFTINGIHVVVLSKLKKPNGAHTVLVAKEPNADGILEYIDQYGLPFNSKQHKAWFAFNKGISEEVGWDWRYLLDLNKFAIDLGQHDVLYKYFDGIIPNKTSELFINSCVIKRNKKHTTRKPEWREKQLEKKQLKALKQKRKRRRNSHKHTTTPKQQKIKFT